MRSCCCGGGGESLGFASFLAHLKTFRCVEVFGGSEVFITCDWLVAAD